MSDETTIAATGTPSLFDSPGMRTVIGSAVGGHTLLRMTYDEWEGTAAETLRRDPAWKVEAFRLGLFAAGLAWSDAERLIADQRSAGIVGQLMRSAGSVSANIAEGYGRRSPKERVRFYEYALGSAGETRAWYVTVGQAMTPADLEFRLANLLSLTRLLLTMIRRERDKRSDWMNSEREH